MARGGRQLSALAGDFDRKQATASAIHIKDSGLQALRGRFECHLDRAHRSACQRFPTVVGRGELPGSRTCQGDAGDGHRSGTRVFHGYGFRSPRCVDRPVAKGQ